MKRLLSVLSPLVFLVAAVSFAQEPAPKDSIRLLTIGNSFADDATFYLDEFAAAGGKRLDFTPMNLGGCSMERHARHLKINEANPSNPEGRPYAKRGGESGEKTGLAETLKRNAFDIVTIQQVSTFSFKPETYEPFASELLTAIGNYAPDATVLIHETWAYRQDHELFKNGNLTQKQMHDGLVAAYRKLASDHGLKIIPVGEAFALARQTPEFQFAFPDPNYDYANPKPGTLPNQTGSLNLGWRWQKNAKTGADKLALDAKHSNAAGKYLGAATFYEVLFGENVVPNTFVPKELTPDQALVLRKAAHQAVENERAREAAARTH